MCGGWLAGRACCAGRLAGAGLPAGAGARREGLPAGAGARREGLPGGAGLIGRALKSLSRLWRSLLRFEPWLEPTKSCSKSQRRRLISWVRDMSRTLLDQRPKGASHFLKCDWNRSRKLPNVNQSPAHPWKYLSRLRRSPIRFEPWLEPTKSCCRGNASGRGSCCRLSEPTGRSCCRDNFPAVRPCCWFNKPARDHAAEITHPAENHAADLTSPAGGLSAGLTCLPEISWVRDMSRTLLDQRPKGASHLYGFATSQAVHRPDALKAPPQNCAQTIGPRQESHRVRSFERYVRFESHRRVAPPAYLSLL